MNAYKIVQDFESAVADYTGSEYAIALDNCTNALFLCLTYWKKYVDESPIITIPKRTYLSVPQSVLHAGCKLQFEDVAWNGIYQLKPTNIYDAAKRFTSRMYIPNTFMCLSFHIKKILKIGKGGCILTDNKTAYEWFLRARYEGRSSKFYKEDDITELGWNMYMTPQQAAHGLALMQNIPEHNDDHEEENNYRDLTEFTIFKSVKVI